MFKYKKLYFAQKAESEKLTAENASLRKVATDMNGAVQRSADEIANLNRQLTEKQIELDTAREQSACLHKELSDTKAELVAVRKELGDTGAELASVSETSEHWLKQADELEGKLKAKEAARSVATANLKRETEANEALRKDLAKKDAEIADLNKQIVSLLEDNETLERDLASVADDGSVLKGKCEGCVNEGNYRKCSSCIRGHAKDKYTPVQPEISSSADDGNSESDEPIIEEGAIVGEPADIDDVPADTDTAELKEAEAEFEITPDAESTADADVAELKEDEITLDVPAPEPASTPAPAPKKKTSRKKKKAAKKK